MQLRISDFSWAWAFSWGFALDYMALEIEVKVLTSTKCPSKFKSNFSEGFWGWGLKAEDLPPAKCPP